MSRHVTYRGTPVDMDSMRRENEETPAVGNVRANARGDRLSKGTVIKTADELARERGRVKSVVVNTGLKGPVPQKPEEPQLEAPKHHKKPKEKELPSGDIVVDQGDSN